MLYVTVGSVAFSVVFAFVAFQAIQQSTDLVFRERLLIARTVAHEIDDDLEHLEQEVQDTSVAITPALAHDILPDADIPMQALCTHWSSDGGAGGPCLLWITDAHGLVLRRTRSADNVSLSDLSSLPGFAEASESHHLAISNGRLPDETDRPAAVFVNPLREGAETVGYLVGEIDRADLKSRMDLSLKVLQGRFAVEVIDDQGMIVTTNALDKQNSPSSYWTVVAPMWQKDQAGLRNHVTTVNGIEQNHVMAFAPLSQIRWGIVVEQEEDEALALPQQLQAQFIGLAVLALVGGLALAWITTNAVVRPIKKLIQATQDIAQGDLDHPLTARGGDEIGTLARRFEQMRVALRTSLEQLAEWNHELEFRVQARTRELGALVKSSHALTQTLDLDELLEILMKETHTLVAMADGAVFFLVQPGTQELSARATFGLATEGAVLSLHRDEAIAGQVYRTQAPVRLQTAAQVEEMLTACSVEHYASFRLALRDRLVRSAIGVPLQSKGEFLGVLLLFNLSHEEAFNAESVSILQALANQAATAIENARLYREAGEAGALRELDRLKSEFVTRASHELRTPMTAIKSLTESLLRPDLQLDADTREEFLQGIDSAADRLGTIVDQLLTLSRVDAGTLGIRHEPVSASAVVQQVVEEARSLTPTRELVVNVAGVLPWVSGDRERLEDVLRNLLSNALKYSESNSPVHLSAERVNGHVVITIADQGIGIPPQERSRIFERFHRVDNALTRRVGGAGLGLYLCKTYVEAMNGIITVEDNGGRGSIFRITLAVEKNQDGASCDPL